MNDYIKQLYFVYEHADDPPKLKYTRFQCFATENDAMKYIDKEFRGTDDCIIVSTPMEKLLKGFVSKSYEVERVPNDPKHRVRVKHVTEMFIKIFHGEDTEELEDVVDSSLFKKICSCDTVEKITELPDEYNEIINGRRQSLKKENIVVLIYLLRG